jgi:hypothetical protein
VRRSCRVVKYNEPATNDRGESRRCGDLSNYTRHPGLQTRRGSRDPFRHQCRAHKLPSFCQALNNCVRECDGCWRQYEEGSPRVSVFFEGETPEKRLSKRFARWNARDACIPGWHLRVELGLTV